MNEGNSTGIVDFVQEEDAPINVTGLVSTLIQQTVVDDDSSSKARDRCIIVRNVRSTLALKPWRIRQKI